MHPPDLRVYVITANMPELGRTHEDVAVAAARGGASVIQFRDKTLNDRAFVQEARRVAEIAREAGILFIVNDRVQAAVEVEADGVHLGQADAGYMAVREIVGPDMIVGLSATNPQEAREAARAGADYIGIGPVFATNSKNDAAPLIGIAGLRAIVSRVARPLVAIGGIDNENIGEVIAAGAAGAAHIAAIAGAPDMEAAVRALRLAWESK